MKIVLTQTDPERLAARLTAAGFGVESCPLVRVERLDGPPLDVRRYAWLVLTSRNGVEALFERGYEGTLPPTAVIGPGTAEALRARGVEPTLVAKRSTQEGVVEALGERPGAVLFVGAEDARDVLARELGADFVALYRTVEVAPAPFPDADLIVLASPSAARSLASVRRDLACVSMGPVTTQAAREVGLRVVAEAENHDLDGLVAAVKLAASNTVSSRS